MNLSQLMQGLFKNEQIPTGVSSMSDAQTSAALMARIRALSPGQIISGEVMESGEGFVKLLVGGNTQDSFMLSAKMAQGITLAKGKHVLFEVKNNGKVLSLSPLYENVDHGANVSRAIEAAGLTVNEDTVHLVQNLMEQGMPIDRESLTSIYQEMSAFRDASLQDILDLHKLQLPVTKENLEQLASYKEQTHQLTGAVHNIAQQLGEQILALTESGNTNKAMQLVKMVLNNLEISTNAGDMPEVLQVTKEMQEMPSLLQEAADIENTATVVIQDDGTGGENIPAGVVVKVEMTQENVLLQRLLSAVQNDDKTAFLTAWKDARGSDALQQLLSRELLFSAEEVADKSQVKDKIKKLFEFAAKTEAGLKALEMTEAKVFDTVVNTKQNVQFLNQINEMYAYVQVPLKLGESDVNGELYVYSNKKNLSAKDGEITAFLRLDMQNLGPVDVYVSLRNSAVRTKFTVADDEMIDFLYGHMDILNARLEKRGYSVSASVVEKQDQETNDKIGNVMEHILEENSNIPAFAHYSFDARA